MLDSSLEFIPLLENKGMILDLEFALVEHHTKGSIALYEPERRVLFCGDFLCFFRQPLPRDGFISQGVELRKWLLNLILKLGSEERKHLQFDQLVVGLNHLGKYNVEFLCSGHGAVLHNDIQSFFEDIAKVSGMLG